MVYRRQTHHLFFDDPDQVVISDHPDAMLLLNAPPRHVRSVNMAAHILVGLWFSFVMPLRIELSFYGKA
jgi:hypothetical protein